MAEWQVGGDPGGDRIGGMGACWCCHACSQAQNNAAASGWCGSLPVAPETQFLGASPRGAPPQVPVPASQVLTIKEGLPVGQAAVHYAGQLLELSSAVLPRTADNLPIIDGHVASLFPNRKETAATGELPPLLEQANWDGQAGLVVHSPLASGWLWPVFGPPAAAALLCRSS